MKIGSIVMFTDGFVPVISKRRKNCLRSEAFPEFYPPVKTIGTVIGIVADSTLYIQWPAGSTSEHDRWWCDAGDVLEL